MGCRNDWPRTKRLDLRHRALLRLCLLGLILLSFAASGTALAAPTGLVLVGGEARWNGKTLSTSSEGATLAYPSGSQLQLQPDTELRIHQDDSLWLDNKGTTFTHVLTLRRGGLDAELAPNETASSEAILIRTLPGLVGALREGRMGIKTAPGWAAVANYQGTTTKSRGGRWSPVSEGSLALLKSRERRTREIALPEAPAVGQGARVYFAGLGAIPLGSLSWTPVERATSYSLSLRVRGVAPGGGAETSQSMGAAAELHHQVLKAASVPEAWASAMPGHYEVLIRAQDSHGFPSRRALVLPLSVVGLAPDETASLTRDGTIMVGRAGTLRLSHVQGLQLATGAGTYWAPATSSVQLYDRDRLSIRLRAPGSPEQVQLSVKRRRMTAHIEIGPRKAIWPGSQVTVAVTVEDSAAGEGESLPAPELAVSLGLSPLALKWRRQGNRWVARVPPQRGMGPWILRVRATDAAGRELGRNFLEVSGARLSPKGGRPASAH